MTNVDIYHLQWDKINWVLILKKKKNIIDANHGLDSSLACNNTKNMHKQNRALVALAD